MTNDCVQDINLNRKSKSCGYLDSRLSRLQWTMSV